MNSGFRIPTLLGLGLLVSGLIAGIFLVSQNQIFRSQASQSETPLEITIFNVSANSASVFWRTDKETTGFIRAGTAPSLGSTFNDERDPAQPLKHRLHFVNLTNLVPETTYYFKVSSGAGSYPPQSLSFKTNASSTPSNLKPLIGTVVNSGLQPVTEALITLEAAEVGKLATITKTAGNFILPLTLIPKEKFPEESTTPEITLNVRLTVTSMDQQTSVATLKIPFPGLTLPPIILGQNIDITPPPSPTTAPVKYDLNKDGVINSIDRSIILKNFGKKPKQPEADLNGDKVVDKKDLEMINSFIPPENPR